MTPRSITETDVFSLNQLCEIVNEWATEKGWNDTPDSVQHKAEQIALMHSELSECLEFVRKKLVCPDCGEKDLMPISNHEGFMTCIKCLNSFEGKNFDDHVPSLTGESAELADVLIRIFHYCGKRNINLGEAVRLKHEYNITRPYRHDKHL